MGFWSVITGGLGAIADAVSAPITEWQRRKTVKAEAKAKVDEILAQAEVAKATALLRLAEQGQRIEADWDARAQDAMRLSWKDEFLLVILISPFIACFIPGLQEHVGPGFAILKDKTPLWYTIALLGIVAAVFGLRWLVAPLVTRLGKRGPLA